jgi:hypothetical protein
VEVQLCPSRGSSGMGTSQHRSKEEEGGGGPSVGRQNAEKAWGASTWEARVGTVLEWADVVEVT